MLELAIIADDLTGAADTSVRFCPYMDRVLLFPGELPPLGAASEEKTAWGVHTGSRGLPPEEASLRARSMGLFIASRNPGMVYKKVDSCMRGQVGAEVEALLEVLGQPCSFIAPAHPEMDRRTIKGVHLVHGTPVAQTEMGSDPVSPVKSSRLDELVAGPLGLRVAHLNLESLQAKYEELERRIWEILASGVRHICFDALEMAHLDKIARLGLKMGALLAGSAGLATALARVHFGPPTLPEGRLVPLAGQDRHLLVVGSRSERARRQVELLMQRLPVDHVLVQSGEPEQSHDLAPSLREAMESPAKYLLLTPQAPSPDHWGMAVVSPEEIVRNLARTARFVVQNWAPRSLLLSGGDTAQAVLDRLEVSGIRLLQELLPGVVVGMVQGGPLAGLLVLTKAGALGDDDVLIRILEAVAGSPNPEIAK